jgi:hypothetical protein
MATLKADGTMYLKDDRAGTFHISWYEGGNKKWHHAQPLAMHSGSKPTGNRSRPGVQGPTLPDGRILISVTINHYIDAWMGAKPTRIEPHVLGGGIVARVIVAESAGDAKSRPDRGRSARLPRDNLITKLVETSTTNQFSTGAVMAIIAMNGGCPCEALM